MAYQLKKLHQDANMALIKTEKPQPDTEGTTTVAVNGLRIGDDVECYVNCGGYSWPTEIWRVCFLTRDGGVIVKRGSKYREIVFQSALQTMDEHWDV